MNGDPPLGISGHLTRAFIRSPLTPLMLLAAFALGIVALFALPREEEPQISVPMVDISVRADGLNITVAFLLSGGRVVRLPDALVAIGTMQ
jgi:hypothetical protein